MRKIYFIIILFFCLFIVGCSRGIPFEVHKLSNVNTITDQDDVYFFSEYQEYDKYCDEIAENFDFNEHFAARLYYYDEDYFEEHYLIVVYYTASSSDKISIKRLMLIENTVSIELKIKKSHIISEFIEQRCYFIEVEKVYDIVDASLHVNK